MQQPPITLIDADLAGAFALQLAQRGVVDTLRAPLSPLLVPRHG